MSDVKEFKLEVPIKAHVNIDGKNDIVDIDTLYLQAPTLKHRDAVIVLKKIYKIAHFNFEIMVENLKDNRSEEEKLKAQDNLNDVTEESDAILVEHVATILQGSDFDIIDFYKKFINFLSMEICYKDAECKNHATLHDLNLLHEPDYQKLIATYITFFFI